MTKEAIDFDEIKRNRQLPSPTGVALNIMRMCRNENVSLIDLAHQIQADPVLAGRLIKLANAGGNRSVRPIVSISTEVLLLVGVHAVRQVALGVSLINSYQGGACLAFDYHAFWARSLSMACVAQAIGQQVQIAPSAELFTCGLLAGIGQLGLAVARPLAYAEILIQHRGAPGQDLRHSERERFTYDQVELSVAMLRDWHIPALFVDAVRFHQEPQLSGWDTHTRRQRLTYLLHLAAQAAVVDITNESEQEALLPAWSAQLELLDLAPEQGVEIIAQAVHELIEWRQMQRFSS